MDLLCDGHKVSIDAGAAEGRYTRRMRECSQSVIAFEPFPRAAFALRSMFKPAESNVSVEEVALSNWEYNTRLFSPRKSFKLGSIETRNYKVAYGTPEVNVVRCRRLDSYPLLPVGFMKIDVEGHELAVLEGATNTIGRDHPNILVEVEERHNAGSLGKVANFLVGYSGFFIYKMNLLHIQDFRIEKHQVVTDNVLRDRRVGLYVNNFLFFPNLDLIPKIQERLRQFRGAGIRG